MLALLATYSQEIPLDMFPSFLPFLPIEMEESPRLLWYCTTLSLTLSASAVSVLLLHLLAWGSVWRDASPFTKGFGAGLSTQVLPGMLMVHLVSTSHQSLFLYFSFKSEV